MPIKVTVIGTGYVGLVTGVCLSHSGFDVCCVDVDEAKIAQLREGVSPIYEPGIDAYLQEGLQAGRLKFETPAEGWTALLGDIVYVAVGTPMAGNGAADLTAVRTVVEAIADAADHPMVLVMKSTVPPGTGRTLRDRYLRNAPVEISYVSNPEFLREGRAIRDWYETDRVVLGSDDGDAADKVAELYADVSSPIVRTDIASAETIKYASNAFLATKISFINEIANVCDCVHADINAVSKGIGLDSRIGPHFLHAGIGYGGSCFPKDVRALDFISAINGYSFELLKAVVEVNGRQRLIPVIALLRELGSLVDRTVAVLGLTFKPDTDDTRESPALDIIPILAEEGATIRAYDPLACDVRLPDADRTATVWEALEGADAAILVTEWPELIGLDWAKAAEVMADGAIVFDGRNALDPESVRAAGLRYMAIGRDGEHRPRKH